MDGFVRPQSPGAVYIVTNAMSTAFEHAIGLADISGRIPLSPTTAMAAFSMTKTLTAIGVLQLVERGVLRLGDRASRYFAHPYDSSITIRHLMTHTAGIPNPIPLRWVHTAEQHDGFDERSALNHILTKHGNQKFKPGERYFYSNIGYWLLGKIIESVSNMGYSAYMRERLFEPLGLCPDDIDFIIGSPEKHAKGYLAAASMMNLFKGFLMDREEWEGYEGKWLSIRKLYVNGPAFGGAIGSAAAFCRILRDLLKVGSVLLSKESKSLLYERAQTSSGRAIRMTLGWHLGEFAGRPYFFKEGGGAGFHSEMRTYPEKGLASVIMVNRTSFHSNSALNKLDSCFLS
jgi:D-alanyl-D-alanine carboxypeptidase